MKQTVSEKALALVEKNVAALGGKLTPQDAATATGVMFNEAYDALTRLMELYVTRVTYDNQGNLMFAFELPLRKRGTKTAAEKWAGVKDKLWRGFKTFYKIWIGLMMIGFFLLMVVLVIALMAASRSGNSRDDDRDRPMGGNMLGGLFRVMMEGMQYAFWMRAFSPAGYAVDRHGYRYREIERPRDAKKKGKSFVIAIYDFALGPERAPSDPLENEKEVAAFLREERGVLTAAEVVALSGGTIDNAEERMADYLVRFQGDPVITEEGVVVGEFESFLSGASAKNAEGRIVPYWEEFEAPYQLSGNSSTRNFIIIVMVLFTLLTGSFMAFGGGLETLAASYSPFFASELGIILLGYMPVVFAATYLLLPLLRWPAVKNNERKRLERNRKKKVMRVIFKHKLWRATADEIFFTMLSVGEKELKKEDVEKILGKLVLDLQGSVELDSNGTPLYTFDRLHREFDAAQRKRGTTAAL